MKNKKPEKIVIKGGYVKTPIEDIHAHNKEVSRGTGIQKAKKGKGSYSRKEKFKGGCTRQSPYYFYLIPIHSSLLITLLNLKL
jgi:alternative ribosome-rescue factor